MSRQRHLSADRSPDRSADSSTRGTDGRLSVFSYIRWSRRDARVAPRRLISPSLGRYYTFWRFALSLIV
ncbi:unnamed protein product, partial [Brenthis ino]